MRSDLSNPIIIKILNKLNDETCKQDLIDFLEEIPQSIMIPIKDIGSYTSDIKYLNCNDYFWNIPYLIELNNVERPIFFITKENIIDKMLNPNEPDIGKLVYYYMIFRHRKRHYGI